MTSDNQPSYNHPSSNQNSSFASEPSGDFLGRHPVVRRLLLILADLIVLVVAFGLAYQTAFSIRDVGFSPLPREFINKYRQQFLYTIPFLALLRLILFNYFGLYRGFARYTSINELVNVILGCGAGTAALFLFN